MPSQTQSLSRLLKKESFVYVPEAYDALGARPVEKTGFKAVYTGGFVTSSLLGTSKPLLTMVEQVRVADVVADAGSIPALADEALFNEIYDTEHVPNILKVPGVVGITRFRDHMPNESDWLVYSAMYFITKQDLPDTLEWKIESDKGRWAPMIRPKVKSRQRRLGAIVAKI